MLPTTENKPLQKAIRRSLMPRAGGTPDASAVAEAALGTWRQVSARIVPVIGAGGADVLFNRALHLTCSSFPWLTIVGDHRDSGDLLANLKTRLSSRETDAAVEASYTLLVTFIELLASMIGESLVERLLSQVWASKILASEEEKKS